MKSSIKTSVLLPLLLLCLPLQAQLNPDVDTDTTKWFNRTQRLGNVDVKASRSSYSRKNNPAVELMRKVIAAKHLTDLSNRDFYQYNKYQKLTFAVNEITSQRMMEPRFKDKKWLVDQVEFCPYNNKLILPVSFEETVQKQIYRREPRDERTIIMGVNKSGVNDLLQTGDILNAVLQDIFTDVNIYNDRIRLLQYPFTSPIGKDAIAFYRYYIEDTVYVHSNLCYHLSFLPNNQQDFGFRGELWVLADSSYQVRRCTMTVPSNSDVNFVSDMMLTQEFSQLSDGSWALTANDMFTELRWASYMESFAVVRNTRLTDFTFDPLPSSLFKGKKKVMHDADAMMRNDDFWQKYRQVKLTNSERSMDDFVRGMRQIKGFKYIIFGLKALIENYVETRTKHPSKIDVGPVNTMFTTNFIDGVRTRISAQTTANLDSNIFFSGYYAHGWGSHKNYYRGDLTWSLNKKAYLPHEFPKRTVTFSSSYDVMAPTDKFLDTDKDNVFASFKWADVERMMFYNRQQLSFEYETYNGVRATFGIKTEHDVPAGDIDFNPFRTTELRAEIRYAPGETYINTKQGRTTVNLDAPVFTFGHTIGFKGVLGGDHDFHVSEAVIYKRFWLSAGWGKVDCRLRGALQWNSVPYMLLLMPEANLSYVLSENTFSLINNMEFLSDRYVSAIINWDMNGKLFNRLPLVRKLKWREWLAVRCLWGALSEKNLQPLPKGSYQLDGQKPYWELSLGIHNIFKLVQIEYVRRLNYNNLPSAHKRGVRFTLRMTF